MIPIDRADGRRIRGLGAFPSIMPYVMRRRSEAAVFLSRDVEVEGALAFIRARNAAEGGARHSLFGLFVSAAVRTLEQRPDLNRFVHRRALYQRDRVSASFIVKKSMSESAPETSAKIEFPARESLDAMARRIESAIGEARSPGGGALERVIESLHRIPAAKALVTGAVRLLDSVNAAPAAIIRDDPLYASVYFANLGSLGLDTPFHHLYEWGTASIFVVMGRIFEKEARRPDGPSEKRRFVNLKFTVDERIAEGMSFARALAVFQRFVARPETIDAPAPASRPRGRDESGPEKGGEGE